MDKDKIQELLKARAQAPQEIEDMLSQVTVLFSGIQGSAAYFEMKGDLEAVAGINRHNSLLVPVIELCHGSVIKAAGDTIMALFRDPAEAIHAAVDMQRALDADPEAEQIHVRIGLHMGIGLEKDHDVCGDVVNAAYRVQQQSEPGQILITDVLLGAAKEAGVHCAKMGGASIKGKDEPLDLYAVAWPQSATQQLIEEVQAQFEQRLKEFRRQYEQLEEEYESAREHWRAERRGLNAELEQLEEAVESARESARQQISQDMQSELRFQLEEALRARRRAEQELAAVTDRAGAERRNLKANIDQMQTVIVEAMERSNNPARMAVVLREQVEAKLAEAREEWLLQWEGERRRLTAEIQRLHKGPAAAAQKREAARRALLERLGKIPKSSADSGIKSAEQWEREYEDAKARWETERDQLSFRFQKLEREVQSSKDTMRSELLRETRGQYEPQLSECRRERSRLEQETQVLAADFAEQRKRLIERIEQLEQALPEAQASAGKQAAAELETQFELRLEEANRTRSRLERQYQDTFEESEAGRRRMKRQIAELEQQLGEAKDAAFRAQRGAGHAVTD